MTIGYWLIGNIICGFVCIVTINLTCVGRINGCAMTKKVHKNCNSRYGQCCTGILSIALFLAMLGQILYVLYYVYRFWQYYNEWHEYGCDCDWSPQWGLIIQLVNVVFLFMSTVLMFFSKPSLVLFARPNATMENDINDESKTSKILSRQQQAKPDENVMTQIVAPSEK